MKKNTVAIKLFFIAFLFLLLAISSCRTENEKKPEKTSALNKNKIIDSLNGNFPVKFDLPETIEPNKELIGRILYRSEFDTITLGKNDLRIINLYFIKSQKKVSSSFSELKKSVLDTLYRVNDSVIFVNDIYFKEKGEYLLDGYIIDEIYLDRNLNDTPILTTIETKVVYPIIVE